MKIEKTVITCDGCGEAVYDSGQEPSGPYLQIQIASGSGHRRGDKWMKEWAPGLYWFCGIACLGHYVVEKLAPLLAPIHSIQNRYTVQKEEGG